MPNPQRRRRADGVRTYETIVRAAADLASQEGLERLTIGALATRLGMSKSGLFAHFGSKEELHLATIEAARKRYVAVVLDPALKAPSGGARLEALCEKTIDYIEKPEFPGGCFFVGARAEFHARTGSVRDAVMANKEFGRRLIARIAKDAQARGDLAPDLDPEQFAYELEAVMDLASWSVMSERREIDLRHARRAVRGIIDRARISYASGSPQRP